MKKILSVLLLILPLSFTCPGQETVQREKFFRDCLSTAGNDVRYLKDFRIQLGEANPGDDFRYKEKMSLWKNNRYRFILCTADNSIGKLIFNLRDELNNKVLSSVDQDSGMVFPYVDFTCNKSGVYEFEFDFTGGHSGSGLSIISTIE